MNKLPITAGMIVTSRMGRDQGRKFVVMQEVDDDFVLVADGNLRTVDRLKKKRRKHLNTAHTVVEELVEKLRTGAAIENHEIRSWLKREEK